MNKLTDEIITLNNAALDYLSKGKFLAAQNLFKENVENNPCFLTFQNLGTFYAQEGITLKNEKVRSALRLGIHYLNKAKELENSSVNLIEIADIYFALKEYERAANYYEQINKTINNFEFHNNFGALLYLKKSYKEASECFYNALNCCQDQDEKININISYAYSLLEIDIEKCKDVTEEMLKIEEQKLQMIDIDVFILLYLCNDFQSISRFCSSIFKEYSIDSSVFSMILDSLLKLNKKDDAYKYLQLQIKLLKGYDYNTKGEIKNALLAYESDEFRKKLIADYKYVPPMIKQCYYMDCKKHKHNM